MNSEFLKALPVILIMLCLISCEKDEASPRKEGYGKGVFISCEGAFNANNGSISWYDSDSARIINNLFETVNGRPAGDVIQSFSTDGNFGVIVANNSQKIEVVRLKTFESASTITGFSYPRHFTFSGNGTGYLSNGSFGGQVYRIDIEEGKVTDTIEVGMGPEQMVISGNYLFVANSGGWAFDNTVSVIDTRSNRVVKTLTVGDVPVALVADRNDNIWVLGRGRVVYDETWTEIIEETDSELVRINTGNMEVDRKVVLGQKGDWFNPSWLTAGPLGETLYFGEAGGVFRMSIDHSSQPAEPFIGKNFSCAGIDPLSGMIFALEPNGYSSPGLLHIYDDSTLVSSTATGIAPGGIVFAD